MSKLDEVVYAPNICGTVTEMTKRELLELKAITTKPGFKILGRILKQGQADLVRLGMATDICVEMRNQYVGAYWQSIGLREDLESDIDDAIERIDKDAETEVPA